jgi:hypothetical protein
MKLHWLSYIAVFCLLNNYGICHDLKGFDDNILFSLNWPGTENNLVINF